MPIRKKSDADASLNTIPDDSADTSSPKETSEAERLHSRLQELLRKTPKQEITEPDKPEDTSPDVSEDTTDEPSLMNAGVFDELITENNGIAPSVSELENLMNQQEPQPVDVPEGATQIIRRVADVSEVPAGTEVMTVTGTDLVRDDLPPVERLTIDPNRKLSWSEKRELKRQRKEDRINAHPIRHAFFVLFMTLITIVIVISGSVVGSYIGYLQYTYEPYEDGESLSVSRPKTWYVSTKTNYNVMTYNIGNGVHTPEYSDFRSEGKLKDGTSLTGEQVRAVSSTDIATNIAGISEVAKKEDCEFYMFQDVDIASTRSSMIDQTELLTSLFAKYSRTL
ncbi:MAG: hypothetical protein HUJ58_05880, partial [Erysipelotrichaceae bacterium]|nr:hypothetical protein [Erysipelotrichaceae bacterium]